MPFAQQLNNQFPWQDQNIISSNFTSKAITAMNFSESNQSTTLKSDSIAQQLLRSKDVLPYDSVVEAKKAQSMSTLPLGTQVGLVTAIVEPIAISNHQSRMNTEEADEYNKLATLKAKDQTIKDNNEVLANAERLVQNNSRAITQHPTKSDLLRAESSLSSSTKLQQSATSKPQAKLSLSSVALDESKTQTALLNPPRVDDKQSFLVNDKALNKNKDAYQQLSYKQEVSTLAKQNKLYQASSAVSTERNIAPKTNETASSNKEADQVPTTFEAKLLNSINPVYPNLAKRRGLEMEVKVDFTIDRDGKVKDINFSQQSKLIYFKSAIRSAIRKWRFSPAMINNRKVESKMTKIFSFSLHA